MTCFVQIFIFTTVYSKIKNKIKIKTFPYLPTLKLKNKSETDFFFLGLDSRLVYSKLCLKGIIGMVL